MTKMMMGDERDHAADDDGADGDDDDDEDGDDGDVCMHAVAVQRPVQRQLQSWQREALAGGRSEEEGGAARTTARGRFTTSTMGGHDSLSLDSAGSGRFSS